MYSEFDVYVAFRQAQSRAKSRPYRLPKNWDNHFSKMNEKTQEILSQFKDYMNTKWRNIDIDKYMDCGFNLYSNFTYAKFFDKKIINLYITRDKNEKRENELTKKSLIESAKFVKKYMKENGIESLKKYGWKREDHLHVCLSHYLKNNINKYFLVYLIYRKYAMLEKEEKDKIPYISERLRDLVHEMKKFNAFMLKIEEDLNNVN